PLLLREARSRVDLAEVHRIEIDLYTTKAEYEQAIQSALSCARRFGIDIPLHPGREQVERAAREVLEELRDRSIEALIDLPRMIDPDTKAVMAVLSAALAAAYCADTSLLDLTVCHMVRSSLR